MLSLASLKTVACGRVSQHRFSPSHGLAQSHLNISMGSVSGPSSLGALFSHLYVRVRTQETFTNEGTEGQINELAWGHSGGELEWDRAALNLLLNNLSHGYLY